MQCDSVRPGHECPLMMKTGCSFHQGACQEVVEKCETCDHIVAHDDKSYCDVFPDPAFKWSVGYCNFATHVKIKTEEKKILNPLKASKMKARGG